VIKWKPVRRGNHWLDCGVGASIVGNLGGIHVLEQPRIEASRNPEPGQPAVMTPDGRPFSILER